MSIKTNELQLLTSIQGADSVLLDSASAGTARVSIANLAEFLAEGDNAVRTALSNKAALSAQRTVEKTVVPARTVELAASELPGFLNSLPRLLTEDLTVRVSGSLTEPLNLYSFYGGGKLTIDGGGAFSAMKGVRAAWCSAFIALMGMEIGGFPGAGEETVLLQEDRFVYMQDCTVTGTGTARGIGVAVENGTILYAANCGVKNCRIAVVACDSSIATVLNTTENNAFSGNQVGADAYRGGIILLAEHTPDLLGGTTNAKGGGIIVMADGTLL